MWRRREFLAGFGAAAAAAPQSAARRNLLLIVIDGQRAEMMGCAGNRLLQTPHLDALAKRGVRFDNSFSAHSVCMPSRASILTGRYPGVHGTYSNGVPLRDSEVTLARVLEEQGYETAAVGKLHLLPLAQPGSQDNATPGHSYFGFRETHLTANRPGPEFAAYAKNHPEVTDVEWIADRAVDFLRRAARASKPFFAQVSFKNLSPPDAPPPEFRRMYAPADMPMPERRKGELAKKPLHYQKVYENQRARGWYPDDSRYRELMAAYYGEMSFIDRQIGRVLDQLESAGLRDQTMIVLTADHGLCLGDHWVWRHGPWLYDQVIKVPLIVAAPDLGGGRMVSELVESVDIMPTVLGWMGQIVPHGVQGKSLAPLLAGRPGSWSKNTAWVDDRESPELDAHGYPSKGFRVMALRSKDWKYVHYPGQPLGELYDLRNDPDEFDNLWNDPARRRLRDDCRDRLLERILAGADPLPVRKYSA
jgi:arylsulfatase A-like enzyme